MLDKSEITKQTPEKSLVEPKKRTGGRNSHGEITIWHRGGGHKKQYRSIDFRREKKGIPGARRGHRVRPEPLGAPRAAALCRRREALHPASHRPRSGNDGADGRRRGHSCRETRWPIRVIPPGTQLHNLELQPGKGAQLVRAAGGSAQLLSKEGDIALVKLPSGEVRNLRSIAWRRSARSETWTTKM